MKKFLLLTAYCLLQTAYYTYAQCPGCQIDNQCGVGVTPVAPTLCPANLPNAIQNQPYDQDLTFFMPRQFVDQQSGQQVTLNGITVTQIVGMPAGLNYTCDQPGCAYTVTADTRGCVKICGTPTVPGNYNVVVSVVANVTTPIGTINNPASFSLFLVVEPAPGGNPYFGFNPPSGCGSINVTYQAYLNFAPNQVTTYAWDFDNGNTSTQQNPPVQSYTTPGEYYPNLITTVSNYVLTDVSVTASGAGWCGDVEEISLFGVCQGAPDLYFTFTNGTQNFTSSAGNNNLSNSWSNLNLVLQNPAFNINFWDDDNVSTDDNLGAYPTYVTAPGTFNFTTPEAFGTYTIALQVETIYNTTDTIVVFANPPVPPMIAMPNDSVCLGDSILLTTISGPYTYQWSQSQTFISDSEAVWVSVPGPTGYYNLLITDTTNFCLNRADSIRVSFVNDPPQPFITFNQSLNALQITNNNAGIYDVAWYNNGELVVDSTNNTLGGQTTAGPYTATFTSSVGCSSTSFPFTLCLAGGIASVSKDTLCCGNLAQVLSEGFVASPGFSVAWAVTPAAFGPVSNQQQATAANNAGYVFPGLNDSSYTIQRQCANLSDSLQEGWYFITPFIAEAANITPVVWDTLTADCRPNMTICPIITGDSGWALDPLVFIFPDGSSFNVNDQYLPGNHIVISQQLINVLPGGTLPCIPLTGLFPGDPNGTWIISATNIGTGAVSVNVPPFQIINYADSCSLITEDQIYTFDALNINLAPGATQAVQLVVPPVPGEFPAIDQACSGFGQRDSIYLKNCFPELTCTISIDSIQGQNVTTFDGSNGFIDVEVTGATAPYTISWNNGATTEDLFNIAAGTYTITVTDANCTRSLTLVITQPPNGIDETTTPGFNLMQNIPNPFNNSTVINFVSDQPGDYVFTVTTIDGKLIENRQVQASAGFNKIEFFTGNMESGVYFYTLSNKEVRATKRMMIAKQ